ncbi:DUF4347 domain-containing protein [Arcobacter sp. L]|uniref:DUF4347 domain-containing protein n=1 Tax=Arcobacter sp. L TaxID=944547 RepID=UPI0002296756|nr:DUF4347 domain-containing protein [Arcobacter sp. L]BAK74308.1 conserved hypothetical protein [Arcobacter sp. L]
MKRKNLKKPMISALEQRILFDGAAVATAVDVLDNSSFTPTNDSTTTNDMTNNNAENSVHEAQAVQGFEKSRKEVAFVDVTVKDYQTLVDGVGEGVETYLVSSLDEIKSILENETNIDAIHILSHGETGEITVGNDVLNKDTLQNFDAVLQSMKTSLTENGDILLYGCNVANDGSGEEFITELATITEADVAASDDLTGSSALGGDWDLEKSSGLIDTDTINISDYEDILSLSVVVEHGNTVETYNNISSGVAHLTSGGNAVAYLVQTSGDMNVDWYSGYSGIIQVTDSSTTVIKSIDMTEHLSNNSNFISDMSITSLKNGGFVVVWTEGNASDSTLNKYYEIFDNNGNQVGSNPFNLLTTTDGGNIKVTSLTNGGFAVAFLNGQTGIVKTYTYNAGSFIANNELIFIENGSDVIGANAGDSTTPTTYGPDASDVRRLFAMGSLSITNLSDGSFVVACSTYDWVNSSYTPLGDFIYKFNADGTKSSFSGGSGQYWERVNWNPGQSNNITALTSFDGGFASLNKGHNGQWQITVYNNDGSLTTTNKLTDTVYYGGNYYNKYYYAVNVGAITSNLSNLYGNQNTYANDFQVDLEFDGTNLIAVLPNDDGGLSIANISTTTGNLIGSITTLSDIPVPSGKNITNPHYLTTASGFSLLYDVQSTNTVTINDPDWGDWDATYVLSDVYQYDLLTFISGPTVSVATGSYTDTVANDTFANITGSISATASSGSILGYGINSGTTGGSTTIGSVTYDVSKTGTYGTLYVKSSDGSYIYVPTSDSVINATTSTVTDSFTIEATDGAGTKGNTLTISINGVNDSPVLSAPTEGSYTDTSATDTFTNTTGTLSASDRDTGTTLTYGISTGTTSGTDVIGGITYDVSKVGTYGTLYVKSTDGSYVYVPNANAINALTSNATDSFTVSSSDGSLNDTQTLTINITGANDAPTAQNKTITIDEDTITVLKVSDFGFADVDTGSALSSVKITSLASHGTLEYFNVSSWIAVTSNQKIAVTDITNGKLRFNPSLNENGTSYATFNFTVNDGTVDSTAKTITYNVTAVNDAPTVANAIVDQNASVSNAFSFTVPSNSFTDVDTSDTLTYSAKLVDSNGDLVSGGTLPSWLSFDANTRTFSGTPAIGDTGIIYIKVTASDNGSLNVSDIFTITTNSGPTVSVATGSYTDTIANDTFANITGSISATASSGSILGYGINSGTTGGSTTIGSVTYDVSKTGTYGTLYVKSSDGSYIYVPTSDSVINATTSTVTDSFTIEATDGAGTKGNTLTISINGVNDSPSISNEIINQTATQNSIFNFTIPTNSFTDVDTSDTLTYSAKLVDSNGDLVSSGTLPSWLSFDANTKTFSGTPTNSDTGIIYIKVTASDNGSLNVSDIFTITVENVNDSPIGNVIISGSPIQGEILTVSNTLTDEDGLGEITYQWYANNEIIDGATNSTYTLTQNEVNKVITVKATYIDGFGTLESVISNVTNQILNINDAPTVLTDNLDVNLAFGDSYTKDISELFKDIDFDNIFTFEATDLPLGLTLNPSTGIISGKANESGEFIVTIKATDNGNPALSVSRTYKIFVLAPVQIENSQPPVSEPLNNTPSNVFSDITLSTFLDTISLGTINNNLGTNITDNIGIGYLNNTSPTLQINDTFNPSQNIPIIKDNGKYVETSATLNVNLNGQVSFDKTIQGSFSIVGITIEDLKIDNNKLDIKIVDTANVQNYIVTQFDGSALPAGLYFNSSTGSISGTIPDNLNELNITIKAINLDGTTRVLNLKLDLKELKQRMQTEVNEKFIGLKEQIAFENQKLDGYGSYLTKLFA